MLSVLSHEDEYVPLSAELGLAGYVMFRQTEWEEGEEEEECRGSKLKDHKIGISPYLLETQSGDFFRELFKVKKQPTTAAIMSTISIRVRPAVVLGTH